MMFTSVCFSKLNCCFNLSDAMNMSLTRHHDIGKVKLQLNITSKMINKLIDTTNAQNNYHSALNLAKHAKAYLAAPVMDRSTDDRSFPSESTNINQTQSSGKSGKDRSIMVTAHNRRVVITERSVEKACQKIFWRSRCTAGLMAFNATIYRH